MEVRKFIKRVSRLTALIALVLVLVSVVQADSPIDATHKWAWGANVGWSNFQPSHGGVTVYDDHLEGYAWAENLGWIRLGTAGSGSPYYDNTTAANYGVNNDGNGNLSGYAWGANVGWINFNPRDSQVTIDANGRFDGYAWGENVGWIHFQHTDPTYGVLARLPGAPIPTLSEWGVLAFVLAFTGLLGTYAVRRMRQRG